MSSEQYNYLSVGNEGDNKEPLMDENINRNDSTFILKEEKDLKKSENVKPISLNTDIYKKQQNKAIKKLTWVLIICIIFMIIELYGGYLSNSITIMSEVAHLLSDLIGFLISIISIIKSRKIAKNNNCYGYHRAEIIGAFVSIFISWALIIWLFYEATLRILIKSQVNGLIMIIFAIIGLTFNMIMGFVLTKGGNNENTKINLKACFIHILGDGLLNVGVLISGGIIFFFSNLSITEPICTYIFNIIVGLTHIRLLKDCIFVFMEGNPVGVDIGQLENDLNSIQGIEEIQNLHLWSIGDGKISLSCNVCCDDSKKTLQKVKKFIQKKYKIDNIDIQVVDNNSSK